jgi:hypothetical protein
MALKVTKVEVWAGEMPDHSGALAGLLEALAGARASVECVIARRQPDKPGSGVAFISPVKGKKVQEAARNAGIVPSMSIATLRVEGNDKPGLGAKMLRAVADAGVNLRGVSAAVIGSKFVAYFGLDNADDAAKAAKALKTVEGKRK